MQVAAFHAIYRRFRRADKQRSREEDFVEAICLTCDDAVKNAPDDLVEQWEVLYDRKNHPKYRKKSENSLDG